MVVGAVGVTSPIACPPCAKHAPPDDVDPLTCAPFALVPTHACGTVREEPLLHHAIGSATESAAMFDVCLRRTLVDAEAHDRGKPLLERIVAMLIKLSRAMRDD